MQSCPLAVQPLSHTCAHTYSMVRMKQRASQQWLCDSKRDGARVR